MAEYWVTRSDQRGKWHRVESEIADRVVTKCGRQMHALDKRGYDLDWLFERPSVACQGCSSVVPAVQP